MICFRVLKAQLGNAPGKFGIRISSTLPPKQRLRCLIAFLCVTRNPATLWLLPRVCASRLLIRHHFDAWRRGQTQNYVQILSQLQQASDRTAVLWSRQDQSEDSFRLRLEASQRGGLDSLRAHLSEE